MFLQIYLKKDIFLFEKTILFLKIAVINGYIIGPNVNLYGADLTGIDLTDIDLTGANLTGIISGEIKYTIYYFVKVVIR
jgi:hypothetical protein